MQVAEEVSEHSSRNSREVYEASALCGRGEEDEEDLAGGGETDQKTAEADRPDSTSNLDSLDPKSIVISSTESLSTAAITNPEAALVKAGPSRARATDYDEEEMRQRAQMKAAALEQGSDDDEVVPGGGGMRPNAWVNRFGISEQED